jgi:hypothetical protein
MGRLNTVDLLALTCLNQLFLVAIVYLRITRELLLKG